MGKHSLWIGTTRVPSRCLGCKRPLVRGDRCADCQRELKARRARRRR